MTTIKLNKPAADQGTPADQGKPVARKKPVRQKSPELRDRTQAPAPKPVRPARSVKPTAEDAARPVRSGSKSSGKPASQHGHGPSARRPSGNDRPPSRGEKPYANDRAVRAAPAPQAAIDSDTRPRLSKVMAERGICSRREADDWIVNGWVKVNGDIIETLGTRIDPDAEIIISTYAKEHQAETVTVLLHKPLGYVSGQAEDGYEPAVVLFNPDNQWPEDSSGISFKRGHLRGLAPAGRLDIDSTGLLILTQDGRVARKLIGDDSTVEKEYLVRVEGELSANGLALLNHGLSLDGVTLKPAKVSWQNEDQLRFVLREGRKRQIRRMCELVGLHVVGLKRIRIGSINLGKLPPGQWRYLAANERF